MPVNKEGDFIVTCSRGDNGSSASMTLSLGQDEDLFYAVVDAFKGQLDEDAVYEWTNKTWSASPPSEGASSG